MYNQKRNYLNVEWTDTRLKWNQTDFGDFPIKEIQVDNQDIWTPHIDLANRIHNYSPNTERSLKATVGYNGKI